MFNAWYYLALRSYRNMSELLGETKERDQTEKAMASFKKSFNEQLWNGSEYRTSGYEGDTDDRVQALAVVAGLVPPERYPRIFNILQSKMYASPYMEKYVIEALFLMGYEEFGLKRLKERFSVMVNDPERTTLYESFEPGWGTANHAWSGGGLTILSQYVCGVSPAEPGWKTINIKPQLGNLNYAETQNLTVAGYFFAKVNKKQKEFLIETTIPAKSQGIIFIPISYEKITLNKIIIWDAKEKKNSFTKFLGIENDYYKFRVNNGNWHFIAKLK
jgi:alpha-L-rhamnosidase